MTVQPLPDPAPSWAVPIAVGALATFLLHSLTLAAPDLWFPACCGCGLTGVPVGFLPAFLAIRQDPGMGPGQGFAISFIATGIGALAVAFLAMVVQGWSVPPEILEEIRRTFEDLNKDQANPLSPEQLQEQMELFEGVLGLIPILVSGLVIVAGGLTGLVTGIIMRRRALPPPQA